jgi:hypothetical protein
MEKQRPRPLDGRERNSPFLDLIRPSIYLYGGRRPLFDSRPTGEILISIDGNRLDECSRQPYLFHGSFVDIRFVPVPISVEYEDIIRIMSIIYSHDMGWGGAPGRGV